MYVYDLIKQKLTTALAPKRLSLIDETHQHHGHKGSTSGASHFQLIVVSDCFVGLTQLARQQLVYSLLAAEMDHIHALSMRTLTPEEDQMKGS